jgi:hypothetical protein
VSTVVWNQAARMAYRCYGDSVGWKNHLGKPMPSFNDLPEGIQDAWVSAVQGGYRYVNSQLDIGRVDSGIESEGK